MFRYTIRGHACRGSAELLQDGMNSGRSRAGLAEGRLARIHSKRHPKHQIEDRVWVTASFRLERNELNSWLLSNLMYWSHWGITSKSLQAIMMSPRQVRGYRGIRAMGATGYDGTSIHNNWYVIWHFPVPACKKSSTPPSWSMGREKLASGLSSSAMMRILASRRFNSVKWRFWFQGSRTDFCWEYPRPFAAHSISSIWIGGWKDSAWSISGTWTTSSSLLLHGGNSRKPSGCWMKHSMSWS